MNKKLDERLENDENKIECDKELDGKTNDNFINNNRLDIYSLDYFEIHNNLMLLKEELLINLKYYLYKISLKVNKRVTNFFYS